MSSNEQPSKLDTSPLQEARHNLRLATEAPAHSTTEDALIDVLDALLNWAEEREGGNE